MREVCSSIEGRPSLEVRRPSIASKAGPSASSHRFGKIVSLSQMNRTLLAFVSATALFLQPVSAAEKRKASSQSEIEIPLGLLPIVWPRDNPYSKEKCELGRFLYFDRRLSADDSVACASCHDPKYAFTDGAPASSGIRGQKGNRS